MSIEKGTRVRVLTVPGVDYSKQGVYDLPTERPTEGKHTGLVGRVKGQPLAPLSERYFVEFDRDENHDRANVPPLGFFLGEEDFEVVVD